MQLLEHVGLLDVYLTDPEFIFVFTHELNGQLGTFGCHMLNEDELFDFVRFRAAQLCRVGRFDSEFEYVNCVVSYGDQKHELRYNLKEWKYEWYEEQKTGNQ